jgi:UDP-glucose 4-epimerase
MHPSSFTLIPKDMKIALTGGAGFIGAHVAKAYLQAGHEVVVVDDLSRGHAESLPSSVTLHRVDITDAGALKAVFQTERPEVVNHHAALVSVRESARCSERYIQVNLVGTQNVLHAALASGATRFIYASSGGAVYGEAQSLPVAEDHPLNPLSVYGESKVLAEKLIHEQDGRFESVILRYGNVYGPGQDPGGGNGVIAIITLALLAGRTATIFGDGSQRRDYIYIEDVARANLAALEKGVHGCFNIATGQGLDLLQVGHQISDALGVDFQASFQAAHPYEVQMNVLDVSMAERGLGWSADVSFAEGLKRTHTWLQEAIALQRRSKPDD